ncbi:MAG: YtxH domain-containing protein [Acidobacteriota bacterium]|nr:YtxH domain-containing protein [Acidobacteriota bacterium]
MARQCSGYGFAFFLAGLGLGAAAGLLLAPHSGEETRRRINQRVEHGRNYVTAQQEAFRRKTEDWMAEGRKRAEGLREKAKNWADRAGFSHPSET